MTKREPTPEELEHARQRVRDYHVSPAGKLVKSLVDFACHRRPRPALKLIFSREV